MNLEKAISYFNPINDYREIKQAFDKEQDLRIQDVTDIANNVTKSLVRGAILGGLTGLIIAPFADNMYQPPVIGILIGLHIDHVLNVQHRYIAKMWGAIKYCSK